MLLSGLLSGNPKPKEDPKASPRPDYAPSWGYATEADERVSVASSQTIATVYRAKNIISDDVARIPFQEIRRSGSSIEQVVPDEVTRNMAYLLQVSPNLWGWTPHQLKKATIEWLLFYGNAYIWSPIVGPRQLLVLAADKTQPVFDLDGNLWYRHTFANDRTEYIPSVEVLQLMINPDSTGFVGRGVITFMRETAGRRLAANKTQSRFYKQGFTPAAYIQMAGELSFAAREKVRDEYGKQMSGAENTYKLAVLDNKVTKFEPINIQLRDAQFLESIQATDKDIFNFFGLPEHMLNSGKQSYNSNEQKYIEYLQVLDSYLVPWEEAARIRWLSRAEQANTYFKFVREALLRMDSKTRGESLAIRIQNGMLTPNEALEKEDMNGYPEGDRHYMASNIAPIEPGAAQNTLSEGA